MVARFDFWSVSLAQKPKSAKNLVSKNGLKERDRNNELTNFHIAAGIKENVVALNVAMDDILAVQMS